MTEWIQLFDTQFSFDMVLYKNLHISKDNGTSLSGTLFKTLNYGRLCELQ